MSTMIQTRALRAIDPLLTAGPWSEGVWDVRGRRVSGLLLAALRESLAVEPAMDAVARACDVARDASPTTSAAWHEVWARVTLVWAVQRVVRAAHAEPDGALREAMLQVAAELAAANARIPAVDAAPPANFEDLVEGARAAFALTRDGYDPRAPETPALAVLLQQLRHTASLLVVGGHSVDNLLRGALARTDRVARRELTAMWSDAPLARRQYLAQRGLVDAAWSLAAHVPTLATQSPPRPDAAVWFARTAAQLAARVDRVAHWVPPVPEDAARVLSPGAAPIPSARTDVAPSPKPSTETKVATSDRKTERAMETNKLTPVLKTLENDAGDAAWRLAGSQFVKLAKEPLIAMLSRQLSPGDESFRARLAAFLDTEVGAAILSSLLSVALSAVPLPNADVTERLSRELRVRAMAGAGDVLADVLMGPLRQVAVTYLQGVPAAPSAPADPAALPASQFIDALRTAAATVEHAPAEHNPTTG